MTYRVRTETVRGAVRWFGADGQLYRDQARALEFPTRGDALRTRRKLARELGLRVYVECVIRIAS